MDLPIYLRVLWRFKVVVALGLLAACALAFLALVRVAPGGSPALKWRKPNVYVSYSQLFVTQPGFPWGSLTPPSSADAGRFTSLAIIFTQLANSDEVERIMLRQGPVNGTVQAATVLDPTQRSPLPLVKIAALADSPGDAVHLARRATSALLSYIHDQQAVNGIPDARRVLVQEVSHPETATIYQARKKTLGIAVFIAVLLATCGLAFVLENLRPRVPAAASLHTVRPDADAA